MDGQNANARSVAASEREAIKLAIEAEEQYRVELRQSIEVEEKYLVELRQSIKTRQTVINQLKRTSKEVKTRIATRRALIAAYKVIPDEVLSRIFTMVDYQPYRRFKKRDRDYCDDGDWKYSVVSPIEWLSRCPLNVCHVSQRWRRVATSAPRTWSELVVDLKKESVVEMMEYWFEKAKAIPVHVTLWCESGRKGYGGCINDIELVVACMKQHVLQVGSLRLVTEDEIDPGFKETDVTTFYNAVDGIYTSALKNMAICSMWTDRDYVQHSNILPPFSFGIPRNLVTLDIRGFFIPESFLTSVPTNLTTLKLDAPNESGRTDEYANILEVLSKLPNLGKLRLCGQYPAVYDPSNDQSPSDTQQIVHMPHLTELTLTRYSCATYIRFLDAPALRYLKIKERQTFMRYRVPPHAWDGIGSLVSSFLARSRPSLLRFSAIDIGIGLKTEELVAWLDQMDTLDCLIISQLSALVDGVTSALALKAGNGVSSRYCPDLKVLKCRRWGQDDEQEGKCPVVRDGAVISSCLRMGRRWSGTYGAGGRISKYWVL